ncbi:hypothetical protein GCM10017688_27680 [Streptomyces ramulosus]
MSGAGAALAAAAASAGPSRPAQRKTEGGTSAQVPPSSVRGPGAAVRVVVPAGGSGGSTGAGRVRARPAPVVQRLSLPFASAAARPASSRATGMRNGEQET